MTFGRDEPSKEHDLSGFDCPTIYDSSIDCCVEMVVVILAAYPLVTPQWIIPLRQRWIPPKEHVELEASDLS